MVFLDDETVPPPPGRTVSGIGSGVRPGSRLRRYSARAASSSIGGSSPASRSPSDSHRSSTSSNRSCRRSGVVEFVPASRRRDIRLGASPQRIRCDGGLGRIVLAPVDEHLSRAHRLGHGGGDEFGPQLLETRRHLFRDGRRARTVQLPVERHVQVNTLAAAGDRVRGPAEVRDQVAHGPCHLRAFGQAHTGTGGVEVEDDPGGGPPDAGRRTATAARAVRVRPAVPPTQAPRPSSGADSAPTDPNARVNDAPTTPVRRPRGSSRRTARCPRRWASVCGWRDGRRRAGAWRARSACSSR